VVCDGDVGGHTERDEHGATARFHADAATSDDVAECNAAFGDGPIERNECAATSNPPDGAEHDIGVEAGWLARANADAMANGDGHAERDAHAQRDEHADASANKHAGGGVDAVAYADPAANSAATVPMPDVLIAADAAAFSIADATTFALADA